MGRARKRPLLIALTVVILGGGVAIAPTAVANYRRPWNERRDLTSMEFPAPGRAGQQPPQPGLGTGRHAVLPGHAGHVRGRRSTSPTRAPTPGS